MADSSRPSPLGPIGFQGCRIGRDHFDPANVSGSLYGRLCACLGTKLRELRAPAASHRNSRSHWFSKGRSTDRPNRFTENCWASPLESFSAGAASATVAASAAAAVSSLPALPPGEEIYDLRGPVTVPFPWAETILWYALLGGLVWLTYRLLLWVTRPVAVLAPPPPPPPDPLEEALKALQRLRASPIWEQAQVKDICEALPAILKQYLRDRFSLGLGPAATTDELLRDLRNESISAGITVLVADTMNLCDAVKYAKGNLGNLTLEDLLARTRDLIIRKDWRV